MAKNEMINLIEENIGEDITIITTEKIKKLIYEIRGQKVMLDVDLAKIYGYETKNFNRQVKNNIEKFPSDFMFRLNEDELLRCKNFTSSWGGTRYLPYVFTEQGIYMLMTVLKGELATKQSLALVRLFKEMKDYISSNTLISTEDFLKLSIQTNNNTTTIAEVKENMLMKSDLPMIFKAFSDNNFTEFLFMNGEVCEASVTYQRIYSKAKKSIFIIDDYISLETLLKLKEVADVVKITIFSDNKHNKLRASEYNQFVTEYPNVHIDFVKNDDLFHDRYIILDYGMRTERIYHCGASSKDAGRRITTITESKEKSLYKTMLDLILQHQPLILK